MAKDKEELFHCTNEDKDKRLDIFLMEKIGVTRAESQKMIKKNLVLLNNKLPKKAGQYLKEGYTMQVLEEAAEKEPSDSLQIKPSSATVLPDKFVGEASIIKETDDYIIINKPSGLLVQPTEANESNTLAAWILKNYKKIKNVGEDIKRPGIVHRLDKDASGVMIIAKTQPMFEHLKKQFKDRTIDKEYNILVHGTVIKDHDVIDFDIDRGKGGRMAARPKIDLTKLKNVAKELSGKEAITELWVEKRFARFSFLRVKIHTGRTHQIRVHMLSYNHPVVGDSLYFNRKLNLKKDEELGRLFLHSKKLCFTDLAGERVCFESELPFELKDFLERLN